LLTVLFVAPVMASRVAAPADARLFCGFVVGMGGFAGCGVSLVPSGLTRAILAGAFLTGVAFWVGSVVVFVDETVGFRAEESLVGALVAVVVVFETAVDVDLFMEDTGIGFLVPIGVRTGLIVSTAVVTGSFAGVTVDSLDSFPVA
jgi:hypothetical protein